MKTNTKHTVPPRRPPAPTPPPPPASRLTPRQHLYVLLGLLGFWLLLFVLVLIEHARSWARLLPLIGVVIVVYGAVVTRKVIKDIKSRN